MLLGICTLNIGKKRSAGTVCVLKAFFLTVPVNKDDACDEESPSYGEEVRERHVVRVGL